MAFKVPAKYKASMASKTEKVVNVTRAHQATINEFIMLAWEHYKEHGKEDFGLAIREAAADKMLQRYDEKIRNGFARAGFELPEGELTQANFLGVINEQTGLELSSLDPESIMGEVDKLMSKRLSESLGVNVTTVFDKDALIECVRAYVLEAIRSGRAAEWIEKGVYTAARRYATYKSRNLSAATKEVLEARARQKRYRQTHRLEWY